MALLPNMSDPARRFYLRILNRAALNIRAVQDGFFDTLLCETDDPEIHRRWERDLPEIVQKIIASRRSSGR